MKRKPIQSEIARRNILKGKRLDSNESRDDTNKELAKSVGLSKSKLRKIEIIERSARTPGFTTARNAVPEIFFDDNHISRNGKHVPLSKETGEAHECEKVKAAQVS